MIRRLFWQFWFIALLACLTPVGAYWQSRDSNYNGSISGGGGGPGSTTTWNPADIGAGITLSGGNLIATASNASAKTGRATTSESSQKWYWEIKANVAGNVGIGIADATESLTNFLGVDVHGLGYYNAGSVIVSNVGVATIQTFTNNDIISIAWDHDNNKIWFRTNGGNWNNSGAANPATNTGGISSGFAGIAAFPAISPNNSADQATVNFGAAAFSFSIPVGFNNIP